MAEQRGLRKRQWFQLALLTILLALAAWKAIDGDKGALVTLVALLVFGAYALGYVIGFRSAKRPQSEPSEDPRSDTEDPVS
ncbi:hypothetical protein ACWET9_48120 [Streptomyces sp. NPDC004059]|uniref:hypothetical protein n=1 Tax=Streptomyces sp. NPDC051917 TaxID=3154754 RepID=UPI00344D167B